MIFIKQENSLGSNMNPRIINDDTPFLVIESVMCVSVGILAISVIFNVYHFSQNSHLQVKSFIQNMCWWMHHIIETGTVCLKYDFYILSLLSFSCNNSDRNFLYKKVCFFASTTDDVSSSKTVWLVSYWYGVIFMAVILIISGAISGICSNI